MDDSNRQARIRKILEEQISMVGGSKHKKPKKICNRMYPSNCDKIMGGTTAGGRRKRSGSKVSKKRAGSKVSRKRAGSKVSRKRAGSKVSRKRAGSKVSRKGIIPKGTARWILHVRKYADDHDIPYGEAMILARDSYESKKSHSTTRKRRSGSKAGVLVGGRRKRGGVLVGGKSKTIATLLKKIAKM